MNLWLEPYFCSQQHGKTMKVTTLKSCEGFMQSDREVRSRRNKLSNRDMHTLKLNPPWRIYPCIRDHTIPENGWHARPQRLTYLHLGGRSNPHNPPFSPRCSPGTSEGIASVRQRFPVPGCKLLKCRKVPRVNMINVNRMRTIYFGKIFQGTMLVVCKYCFIPTCC